MCTTFCVRAGLCDGLAVREHRYPHHRHSEDAAVLTRLILDRQKQKQSDEALCSRVLDDRRYTKNPRVLLPSTNESQSGSAKNCSSSNDRFPHRLFPPSFIYRLCLLKVFRRPRTSTFQFVSGVGVKLVSAAQSISNF